MTRFYTLILISLLGSPVLIAQQETRIRQSFDFDWKFILNDSLEANAPTYDDTKWQDVHLPHDWSISQPLDRKIGGSMGYMPGGIGWYRKTFDVPAEWKNKKVYIYFDGVYHQSDVYVNGEHLGFHPYGYTGFEYDMSPHLNYGGTNEIFVKVDHSNYPSSRWYSGSGIYRHVWLKVVNPIHVATWGTYVTTPSVSDASAEVRVRTTVTASRRNAPIEVRHTIINAVGEDVARNASSLRANRSSANQDDQLLVVHEPVRWDIDNPYLYTVETTLGIRGRVVDKYTTTFGIRTIRFDDDEGFYLNDRHVKLKGVNLHPDAGSMGTAVPDRSYLRRLQILKEYGCNAIRCAHNPPTSEFLDMCDSLGFVVIDEIFDKWKTTGWFFGYYTEYFDDWWQSDMDAMLLRDRNHPSVILWSVGNETSEQNDTTGAGTALAKMLCDYVHQVEPTRPTTLAIAPGDLRNRKYHRNGFTEVIDVVGYNYSESMFDIYREMYPDAIMYVAEAFPYYTGREGYVRDYYPSNPWYTVAERDYLLGQFVWAGADYLGESSGYPSTGWPTGLFDACMFEKPRAAFHRSVWRDDPMVRIAVADQALDFDPGKDHWSWPHLAEHWNWPQYRGHIIEVRTITNCDSVSLWVNDKWMGKRSRTDFPNNTIVWHVPYADGLIRATGFNGDTEVASYQLTTAGEATQILLSADRTSITADGQDLSHITVRLVDDNGIHVANADRVIQVEVSGQGRLKGLDNGDLRRESPVIDQIRTYFGKALVTIQSQRTEGDVRIIVSSEGLPDAVLAVRTE